MATVEGVVKHYRNLSGQHLEDLWSQIIYKQGVKGDNLRHIMMFYIQHKIFPSPPQKFFDTLMTLITKETSSKMKNVIFHIIEEICPPLESSILETVRLSTNSVTTIELLNSTLIVGCVLRLDDTTVLKLFDLLKSESITSEEGGKLLMFLNQVAICHPSLMPTGYVKRLGELMAGWLCNNRALASGSSQFFARSDKSGGIEVDGTHLTPGDIFTVLTFANTFNKSLLLGIHTFSMLRDWLAMVEPEVKESKRTERGLLLGFVREYCSLAVRQCLRSAQLEHDKALQKAVLCEVLDILYCLVQLDKSQHLQSLLIVKRIQRTVGENFRSDPRDISIFIRLLKFLLRFGETTENQQPFCEEFLNDIVHRSYSSDLAAFDIANFLVENGLKLHASLLCRFFPNLLKLVACHPASLVEEYIILVTRFVETCNTVEILFSLIDLPVLSATLCLHQASSIQQLDKSTSLSPTWVTLLENVRSPSLLPSYNYMLRNASIEENELPSRAYVKVLTGLANHSLVVTCAQVVPLLMDAFFVKVKTLGDVQVHAKILCAVMKKIRSIYNVHGYTSVLHKNLSEHVEEILQQHPELVFTIQSEIIDYISVLDNNETCPQLYFHLVWSIGAYTSPGQSKQCNDERLIKYYETLECILYEMLAQITSEEKVSLMLLNVMSSTLAKLASRCPDLIPRLLLCFSKVQRQVSTRLQNVGEEEKQVVHDRVEELITFLQNPNIASPSVVISTSKEIEPAMTAFLRILAQVADAR